MLLDGWCTVLRSRNVRPETELQRVWRERDTETGQAAKGFRDESRMALSLRQFTELADGKQDWPGSREESAPIALRKNQRSEGGHHTAFLLTHEYLRSLAGQARRARYAHRVAGVATHGHVC